MKTLKLALSISILALVTACGGGGKDSEKSNSTEAPKSMVGDPETYDPKRGEGKWTAENVSVGASLDAAMATAGENIANVKCTSCHKMTEEKLVGPGWKGITTRKKPEWIMNFITNPDPMIEKDPEVQAMLELCLVRMPNQNLSDDDARHIVEFMRKIDGVK
ncbi:MAG TPA: cytochrome c [Bacteroidia bacterium]|nr:cytochrome c [Bacteroidia bacterium]